MKIYDKEQLQAIQATGGHYLVLAPPGCGKTDILSERIVYAHQQGVAFSDMLCLTFTNRASRGMKDRVKQKVGDNASDVFVGNVHRFCSNFLYTNALIPQNTAVIDEDDLTDILLSFDDNSGYFQTKHGLDKTKISLVDNIDSYISQKLYHQPSSAFYLPDGEYDKYWHIAQQANFEPSNIDQLIDEDNNNKKIVKITLQLRQYKKERGMITFSDILIEAYEELRKNAAAYKRYPWIQVDEVQDLNSLQIAIIDLLLDESASYTVMYLGDEQQAIFSFMGAKMDQLEKLKNRCQGQIMTLGNNYRSPKYLLDIFNTYAEEVLGVNPTLLPKSTHDVPHNKLDLILAHNRTADQENERVSKMIRYYLQYDNERVAILVPTNRKADHLSAQLIEARIDHFKISGADMFRTKDYKTLSSFFSVVANDFNAMAWARLLYGIRATTNGTSARNFVTKLKRLMMTPSDLLTDKSYIARFNETYETREFVFFDTETTGLNVLEDDIVQIAAFRVRNRQRVPGSDFNIFIHTDRQIPAKLGVHDNPMIEAYAHNPHYSREEGLALFLQYIGDRPLLGHNVTYDYRILQSNVERTLHEHVTFEIYDSLRLIKSVEPNLKRYKLEYLLKELQLEGRNSHLADEDIAATKALVDYCYVKSQDIISEQEALRTVIKVKNIVAKMQEVLAPKFEALQPYLYQPTSVTGRTMVDEFRDLHDEWTALGLLKGLGRKFDIFLEFLQSEWIDTVHEESIYDELSEHINDMTTSISEGDLINSEDLVRDRVFIMTVHKGKGLEFDNVVILEANDGTYPFYTVNEVLASQQRHSKAEVEKAEQDRKEDARKFYVGLSRAKKRLCISYSVCNSYGYKTRLTPFMKSIEHYFYSGRKPE